MPLFYVFCNQIKKNRMKENENVGLPVYQVSDSEIYNDCPQLFKKVPAMQDEEKFKVGESWWVPVRVRDGGKEDGTAYYIKTVGTFSVKLGYTILDKETNKAYKICAYVSTQENRPVALKKIFFGDENGMITLYKNNVEDQMAWYALMLAPFNRDNVLGLDNNGSPYLIEYVNEAAMINARASLIEQRRAAERALEQITDVDVLFALSQQLNPVAPYNGTKALQPLIVYLDGFIQSDPNKVVDAIQDLDAIKIRQNIDDAITMGIIINDKPGYGWYFTKGKTGNKGIVNYAEGTDEKSQKQTLVNYLLGSKGAADKLIMQKELDKALKTVVSGE